MSLELKEAFSGLFAIISKEIGKQILTKIFSGNEDRFKKVVERAVAKLDSKYNFELFGGNLRDKLLKPTVVEKLKKLLLPFDPPTEADFDEDEIYFPNLPPEFFADFQETLLNELISDPFFADRIISVFTATAVGNLTTDVKSVGQDVGEVKNIVNVILEAIRSLQSQKDQPLPLDPSLPPKISYQFDNTLTHIPKVLYRVQITAKDYDYITASLSEILAREKRVLMLSAAGMGKSIEMMFFASEANRLDEGPIVIKVPLNLYTGDSIEDLIEHEMPQWQSVPAERLVLMFDGLDEVHIDYFEVAIKKLIHFAQLTRYSETTILVSCRDNFFNPEFERKSQGNKQFAVYKLKELDYQTSLNFIHSRLGTKADGFLRDITSKSLQGLFTSPFFLNYLVELFENDRGLPESKVDLFERIITYRLEGDKKRFATKKINILKKEQLIRKEMGRLALIMESLGRNVITASEFEEIVPEYEEKRILLEHTFLFDHGQSGWQFEHNNFQEFLAANALSQLQFEKIIRLITVSPEHAVVKPSWVNTISFLFLLVPRESELFTRLLKCFIDNDRELLLRFEQDRVDLATREQIFITILEYYQGKGLVTRSEKFDLKDLADFVSDSENILDYLASKITVSPTTLVLSECCSILLRLKKVNSARQVFQPILERHALDPALRTETRYNAVFALTALHWQDEKFLTVLMPTLDLKQSQYDRAGLYKYLSKSGFQNKYVRTVLDLVQYEEQIGVLVNSRPSRPNFHLGDESINRAEYFNSVDDADQIKIILEFCAECEETFRDDLFVRGIIDMIFEKAKELFLKGRTDILKTIVKISGSFAVLHREEYGPYFIAFIDATDTRPEVCRALYNNGLTDERSMNALAMLIDKPFIDFLVEEFKAGQFAEKDALALRGELNWWGPFELHDYYYDRMNRVFGDAFLYPKRPDWKANNDLRNEKDLELIMDKDLFLAEMRKIYEGFGKNEITENEISELNRSATREIEKPASNICIMLLLETIKPVPLERFERRFQKGDDWLWFQVYTLLQFDLDTKVELKKAQIDLIEKSVRDSFHKSNFENAFNNETDLPSLAHIAYFVRRFDIPLSKEQYTKLLWVSSSYVPVQNVPLARGEKREPLIEWIVPKIGIDAVESALRSNFVTGIQGSTVIRQYFETARKHGLNSLLPVMTEELKKQTITSNDFFYCVTVLLEMGGDVELVECIIENDARLDENDQLRLIDELIELKYPGVLSLLQRRLQMTEDEEGQLLCAERLIRVGVIEGLQYYKDWIARHKTLPRGLHRETIKLLPAEPTLKLLFDKLDSVLSHDFDRDHLLNEDQDLFDAINIIGALSRERYETVKLQYNALYEKYQNKALNYWLLRLDKDFYSAKAKNVTLTDVIQTIDGLI